MLIQVHPNSFEFSALAYGTMHTELFRLHFNKAWAIQVTETEQPQSQLPVFTDKKLTVGKKMDVGQSNIPTFLWHKFPDSLSTFST